MQLLVFIVVYPWLWVISRLPFFIIYRISDVLFCLIYYIVRYRRKVVQENLRLVFPSKDVKALKRIEKDFYRHMCDMFLEMIKTMGISKAEMLKRFRCENIELLQQYEANGQSTIVMFPHYASWEWSLSINAQLKGPGYGIYQKIQNSYFDKLIRDIRSKFGTTLLQTDASTRFIARKTREGEVFTLGIISDQSPLHFKAKHWTEFMGITVPVHVGGEVLSKTFNLVPLYLKVKKVKRGYYSARVKCLTATPKDIPDYNITDLFLKETEASIKEAPEFYFWTHKRWKHRHNVPEKFQKEANT